MTNVVPRICRGFSMIEVLVSLLLICVGVLGMAALQGRTVQYTTDATQRGNAIMLASELMEMMRSNRSALLSATDKLQSSSNYYKAANASFPSTPSNCASRTRNGDAAALATADLGCWQAVVQRLLPVNSTVLKENFVICQSKTLDSSSGAPICSSDGTGTAVMIQLAWLDAKSGMCSNNICTYTLRSEL